MVLGIAMMAGMLPTMIGLNEATKGARDREESRREDARRTRTHLMAVCDVDEGSLAQRQQVHNAKIYLGLDRRIYITKDPNSTLSPFNGHFENHPSFEEDNTAGLISMSGEDKPLARWVFLDSDTNEMRWGGRQDSDGHVCGPFDLTDDEQYITLEDDQRWLAVRLPEYSQEGHETKPLGIVDHDNTAATWRLYFDRGGGAYLPAGAEMIRIYLKRTPADS
ncbi:uncharacterized protein N7484_006164 [Penicillium longicatenatum]|uniref:uncharacterized protein n=1 Tax=Penicillium longicatenatum TaxID=1561947 RepID=UPI0025498106|nr:uncharacterized protein N7484_006164 [Penicillium longicatenatum]KAJ5643657.1 hypothetical protein N7484_006164 [Penicillium longicatenatum]